MQRLRGMRLKDYKIAIPSYKRADVLEKKTLAFLQKHNIPSEKIFIFVANKKQREIYKLRLPNYYNKIVVAGLGLAPVRNFIRDYFNEGQYLVSIDDDVNNLEVRVNEFECKDLENLDKLINSAFKVCDKIGCSLWGVYPLVNPKFMNPKPTADLRFIIGSFFGLINTHDKNTYVSFKSKDDYQRTIKFYLRDGKVLRLNNVGVDHGFRSLSGGIQAIMDNEQRDKVNIAEIMQLVEKYPTLCEFNKARKGRYELRLKR